ncbi:MAG: GAF domain-containing SpoIIE family protein phosphatase [Planctomycetota bacterium]
MSTSESQVERLRRILDVARHMAATTDLDVLLRTIVDATREVLTCERATIFLYDATTNELYSRVATGVKSIRFPADRGIAGAAARDRAVVNVTDAYADERFNPEIDRETGFRTRNLLTFPLENLDGDLMGVLQALNKTDEPFDHADEELARVLSAQAGVALHRWRLLEEYAEKQRMARDLEIARQIQLALFPKENPTITGYEIAGWNRSADETGGDCYDFMPLEDGRLAMLLADATGHGIGAALVIAQCRSLVRAMLSVTQDLARVVASVNRLLTEDLASERFVTAFFGILDPRNQRLEYIAAGQGPLMFLTSEAVECRTANALPLGVLEDLEFPTDSFDFQDPNTLVLLTDGFYEAANPASELFGEERVTSFIRNHPNLPLPDLIAALHDDVTRFTGRQSHADDLTAVLVRRSGSI